MKIFFSFLFQFDTHLLCFFCSTFSKLLPLFRTIKQVISWPQMKNISRIPPFSPFHSPTFTALTTSKTRRTHHHSVLINFLVTTPLLEAFSSPRGKRGFPSHQRTAPGSDNCGLWVSPAAAARGLFPRRKMIANLLWSSPNRVGNVRLRFFHVTKWCAGEKKQKKKQNSQIWTLIGVRAFPTAIKLYSWESPGLRWTLCLELLFFCFVTFFQFAAPTRLLPLWQGACWVHFKFNSCWLGGTFRSWCFKNSISAIGKWVTIDVSVLT